MKNTTMRYFVTRHFSQLSLMFEKPSELLYDKTKINNSCTDLLQIISLKHSSN